ncbi:hypothetical protein F898_03758 [Acinetobacter courvalinii]|nr:hypothetical protein F898_03758 [Acinetobacter courvalinii]
MLAEENMTTQDILGITVLILALISLGTLLLIYIKDMHDF